MEADRSHAIHTVPGRIDLQARGFQDSMNHLTNVIVILDYYGYARCAHLPTPRSPLLSPLYRRRRLLFLRISG
ncbi:hypothetical protein GCM10023063_03930 [Arthrobacter methylotrophus]